MNNSITLPVVASLLCVLGAGVLAGEKPKPGKHGKDVLHISIEKRMDNASVLPDARGDVKVELNSEGDKSHQDIHLKFKDLTPDTSYQLAAQLDDDTNLTSVVDFTTDDKGNADLDLQDKGKDKPVKSEAKKGKFKMQLPASIEPVTGIHALVVLDGDGTSVLTADLTTPDKFEYLVKRDLSSDTVDAMLNIKANGHKAKARLEAKGLTPGADYSLVLNGNVVDTVTADEEGHVNLQAELDSPADIFALQSVALLDADSNTVVSTTLP